MDPSCIDEVWGCAMPGFKYLLGIPLCEDLVRKAAGYRVAFSVPFSGGETPIAISRVLGDIGVTSTRDPLRRGQGCEPVVADGIISLVRDGFLWGGAYGLYGDHGL